MARSKRRRVEDEYEEEEELPPSDADEAADLEDAEQQQDDEQQDAGPSSKRQRSEYVHCSVSSSSWGSCSSRRADLQANLRCCSVAVAGIHGVLSRRSGCTTLW